MQIELHIDCNDKIGELAILNSKDDNPLIGACQAPINKLGPPVQLNYILVAVASGLVCTDFLLHRPLPKSNWRALLVLYA